jgi:hypothetical protein
MAHSSSQNTITNTDEDEVYNGGGGGGGGGTGKGGIDRSDLLGFHQPIEDEHVIPTLERQLTDHKWMYASTVLLESNKKELVVETVYAKNNTYIYKLVVNSGVDRLEDHEKHLYVCDKKK